MLPLVAWELPFFKRMVPSSIGVSFLRKQSNGIPTLREMLSVVYGLEKFHYYIYGRHVVIETNHKPLETIFKKHLSSAPRRIARMMLRIQKYDVQIKDVPGKDIPLADAFSRLNPCSGDCIEGLDVSMHEISMHLNASPTRIQQIQFKNAKDPVLTSLMTFITHGWPDQSVHHTYMHIGTIEKSLMLQMVLS